MIWSRRLWVQIQPSPKYRLSIQLYKTYNKYIVNDDRIALNMQQNFNTRQSCIQITDNSNLRIGKISWWAGWELNNENGSIWLWQTSSWNAITIAYLTANFKHYQSKWQILNWKRQVKKVHLSQNFWHQHQHQVVIRIKEKGKILL